MKQKIVLKVQKTCRSKGCFSFEFIMRKFRKEQVFQTKVMKKISEADGVASIALEGDAKDKVVVIGDGIDAVNLTNSLREKVGRASLETLEAVKEEKIDDNKGGKVEQIIPIEYCNSSYYSPYYVCYPYM